MTADMRRPVAQLASIIAAQLSRAGGSEVHVIYSESRREIRATCRGVPLPFVAHAVAECVNLTTDRRGLVSSAVQIGGLASVAVAVTVPEVQT